ncbi:hypothetical protein N0V88_007022 [Collariella sp. IMI 366227]|nr:hypothetical protein N0V88_007022 [Collariella sp. IMI 366227]
MDPRQPPQHPFSRNAASPFSRPSFAAAPTAATSQAPYPTNPAHPPATAGPYADMHSRKPSDPHPYYPPSRQYPESAPGPMPPATHARHQSASSIPSGPAMTRGMPPPTSPPQQQQQPGQGPNSLQLGGPYSLPQPRAPQLHVGPSTAFPRGRELPALDSLPRTGSSGSSMSISSMLGGPPPHRESNGPPQYAPGPPSSTGPGPSFNQQMHVSPRTQPTNAAEYGAFRRPQTPEHHRMYDARDPRAAVASPPVYHSTPEVQRYGTPQSYGPRGPPLPPAEQGREPGRMSGGGPPRPMSPPKQYGNVGPPRPVESGRPPVEMYAHREELRPSEEYNPDRPIRVMKYEDPRFMAERERQERERQERELELRERELRERERRDMAMGGMEPSRAHGMHAQEYVARQQMEQRAQQYGRPPDPRDAAHWPRPGYDAARPPYDPAMHPPRHQEYPGPHYPGYGSGPADRHHPPPHAHHQHGLPPPAPAHPQSYESPDRQRVNAMHLDRHHPQQQPPRTREEAAVPPPSVAYGGMGPSMYEPARNRSIEETSTSQSRGLLAIQEMNRKGRVSPLPQAVQGAQPQITGPAGEPGIKSEFGRMFSGIGSGVGTISSPVPAGAQLAYGPGVFRRDDMDAAQEQPVEVPKPTGRGKRRKLKEEDEEGGNGRATPVGGRAKKAKPHSHHHHQNVKGSTPIPVPATGLARDLVGAHHHHHVGPRAQAPNARAIPPPRSPSPVYLPKPKQVVSSKAVLDSVVDRPRTHLGDVVYEPVLKPARHQDPRTGRPPRHAFRSAPKPLPWDLIEGKENCTLTMKIGKENLTAAAREDITSQCALWGTDVYTDDSDVIAACIHAGWIRGEWPDDVDVTMLGLDEGYSTSDIRGLPNGNAKNGTTKPITPSELTVLTEPPQSGPMSVPSNRDLHVTLLILPRLEKYASTTRFGIKSREFGGPVGVVGGDESSRQQRAVHDGISFMITCLRWVTNGGVAQNRLRGKVRRERIRKALMEKGASKGADMEVDMETAKKSTDAPVEQQPDSEEKELGEIPVLLEPLKDVPVEESPKEDEATAAAETAQPQPADNQTEVKAEQVPEA